MMADYAKLVFRKHGNYTINVRGVSMSFSGCIFIEIFLTALNNFMFIFI